MGEELSLVERVLRSINEPSKPQGSKGQQKTPEPERVPMMDESPFHIGDQVAFRIPINVKGPQAYDWQHGIGVVELVDSGNHLALIIPQDSTPQWVWVNLCFIEPLESPPQRKEP